MPTVYNKVVIDGVTKIDLSQDTVTSAEHILAGHTGHLANGNQVPGTGSGGGASEFVITLTKNANNLWETNKTFAEITTAYNAGNILRVAAQNPGSGSDFSCETYCEYDNTDSTPNFYYQITWFDYDDDIDNGDFFEDWYTLNTNGLTLSDRQVYEHPRTLVSKTITANGTYNPILTDGADGYSSVIVNVPSGSPSLQAKTNINPTTSSQTITADSGFDGLSSVQINAMPSGTAGTPTATKGTVSNHSVTVTPSVTNTTGYITGGTKTGTAVTVSASELVSGSETKTSNNTYDVTNLAELVVNVPTGTARSSSDLTASGATVTVPAGLYSTQATKSVASGSAGTPTASKGTVSNHSITVTPSVTNTTGYITGGTKTGTGVTVSASELASGNKVIVDNGTNIDVVGYSTVSVAVPFSTITVSSSSPTGGSNGDIWVKTS